MVQKSKVTRPPLLRAGGFLAVFVGAALALIGVAVGGDGGFHVGLVVLVAGIISLAIHYMTQGRA